jgi:hypothetical protein
LKEAGLKAGGLWATASIHEWVARVADRDPSAVVPHLHKLPFDPDWTYRGRNSTWGVH